MRAKYKRRELATKLLLYSTKLISDSIFKFERTDEAANLNWDELYKLNFDLQAGDNPVLAPTFEFNNITYLDMVIESYPSWRLLKEMITKGINYPLEDIDDNKRMERLKANIDCGNYPVRDSEAETKIEEFIDN